MFRITDRAARELKTALSKAGYPDSACFRIGIANNEVRLVVDQERSGDATIEHEGETLVVFDTTAGDVLCSRELDFDGESSGLVLSEAK
jgi:hypothetical protein